jgi:hypothetical protein
MSVPPHGVDSDRRSGADFDTLFNEGKNASNTMGG